MGHRLNKYQVRLKNIDTKLEEEQLKMLTIVRELPRLEKKYKAIRVGKNYLKVQTSVSGLLLLYIREFLPSQIE